MGRPNDSGVLAVDHSGVVDVRDSGVLAGDHSGVVDVDDSGVGCWYGCWYAP